MKDFRVKRSRRGRKKRNAVIALRQVPAVRMIMVFVILCFGLSGLVGRMVWLQILQAPILEAKARAFQTQRTKPLGKRRSIVERTGRIVALDEKRFRLWAHPRYFHLPGDKPGHIRDPRDVATRLSGILGMTIDDLLGRLNGRVSGVKLAESIAPEIAAEISALGISGLDLEPYPQRIYPQGSLFANVVGFLNQDRVPQAGLEQSRNEDLLRYEQPRSMRRGADGTPLPDDLAPGAFFGDDLRLELTLDARLQELAVKSLSAQVDRWNAKKGVAIVMDITNGELLALASTPTYDPNNYWEYSHARFREWSVQDLFEPGSTFKPINLAIALQEGVIDANGTVNDTGSLRIGGWSIYNNDRATYGVINFPKLLQVSSNIGMVKTMRNLKPSLYWEWLRRLGLDSRPDTDLPGAIGGHLKTKENFVNQPIEPAAASFGQGFSLTPLKLVQLHALIANGGQMVSPHITRGLRAGVSLASSIKKPGGYEIFRPEVTKTVLTWMETVVDKGSGKGVKTPGYRIAGKTGTAQKALNGIYQEGAKICSFVASLPVDNPRYVVLVAIDEPSGSNAYGSTVAVPVAKEIIDGLIVLEKIPPSLNEIKFNQAKAK